MLWGCLCEAGQPAVEAMDRPQIHAKEMLDSCDLLPEERRLLEDGVEVFGVLKAKYHAGY